MKHVFICHSTVDKAIADAIVTALEARNIQCWIAPRDIPPYSKWAEAIVDAIDTSSVVVLVLSPSSNDSPQVEREIGKAVSKKIPIIPFRIDDKPLSKSLDYFLSTHQWLDAFTPPLEKHLQKLADAIEKLYTKQSPQESLQQEVKPTTLDQVIEKKEKVQKADEKEIKKVKIPSIHKEQIIVTPEVTATPAKDRPKQKQVKPDLYNVPWLAAGIALLSIALGLLITLIVLANQTEKLVPTFSFLTNISGIKSDSILIWGLYACVLVFEVLLLILGRYLLRRGISADSLTFSTIAVKKWWWIPPVFGFIGGIISWISQKNNNWHKAVNMLVLGTLTSFIWAIPILYFTMFVHVNIQADGAQTEVIADNQTYPLPLSLTVLRNKPISIEFKDPNSKFARSSRDVFVRWSDNGSQKHEIIPNSNLSFTAYFKKQYELTIISKYGKTTGEGWYDAGDSINPSITPDLVLDEGIRATFTGWTSPVPPVIDAPTVVVANWQTQYMRANISAVLNGPPGNVLSRNPQTTFQLTTDVKLSKVTVDTPDKKTVTIPPFSDAFSSIDSSTFRYAYIIGGLPQADGIYFFKGWDTQENLVIWDKEIYVGGLEADPPQQIRATIQEGEGILLSWDSVPSISGSFEPEKKIGYYQININSELGGSSVSGAQTYSTSHLIPINHLAFGTSIPKNTGKSLGELNDGIYRMQVSTMSQAPSNSGKSGLNVNSYSASQNIRFNLSTTNNQKTITILSR